MGEENNVRWLTPKDIEKRMQLSHGTVNKLFHLKGFPMVRVGKTMRIKEKDFEEYMNAYKTHTINI